MKSFNRNLFVKILCLVIVVGLAITGFVLIGTLGKTKKPDSKAPYTVNYNATEGGKIVGKSMQWLMSGEDAQEVTAIAEIGYYFVQWSDGVTSSTRQDKNVLSNVVITAEFTPITDGVTVTYNLNCDAAYFSNENFSTQVVQKGTDGWLVEVRAIGGQNGGLEFVKWSDGVTTPVRQDKNVTESFEVTAIFAYPVNYLAEGNGQISGPANQMVEPLTHSEAVTAVPDKGYTFAGWSDGVKTRTRFDAFVIKSFDVIAIFEWRETDKFTYNYDYPTRNYGDKDLTLTRGETAGVRAIVPERDYFTFGGWFLDENLTEQAFDADGNSLLGEDIFNSPSRDLFAKWTVREEYVTTYKILMVYVTAIDAELTGNDGTPVNVHYRMTYEERQHCNEITARFSETLNDMLDGLVNFEVDSYFTVKTIDASCFHQETDITYTSAELISELLESGIMDEYRTVLTLFSCNEENVKYSGGTPIKDDKYGVIPLDGYFGALSDNKWDILINTCVYQFIFTIEKGIVWEACQNTSYYVGSYFIGSEAYYKLLFLNQYPYISSPFEVKDIREVWINSEKVGIPYSVWTNEIFDVVIKRECINGQLDGYAGTGTVDYGGKIAYKYYNTVTSWSNPRESAYIKRVPKNSRYITLYATPFKGYKFIGWSDGCMDTERVISDVQSDITLTACFERQSYTVEYIAGEGGHIEGDTVQTLLTGELTTWVTAVPDEGYRFVGWFVNGNYYDSVEPARSDVIGKYVYDENGELYYRLGFSVTAIFEKISFSLNYVSGNGGYLLGNTTQTVAYGENGTKVTAIPNDGYKFVKWSDGETNDTRCDIAVNSSINVTAEFEFLYAGGDGTQLNPYKIENYTQLLNMRYFPDKVYSLSCNLDLSGINHEPIFNANECFTGMFFGGGKTIKNLTVATQSNFPSLFGMVMGGIVENLNLENVSITTIDFNTEEEGVQYYVGTVAGYFAGLIENVTVSGKIEVGRLSYDGVAVGGLIGMAMGTIRDCNVDMQIDIKNVFSINTNNMNYPFVFGGLIGVGDSSNISNCQVQGEINVTECWWIDESGILAINKYTDILVGGLVGYYFTYGQVNAYLKDCETDLSIYGDNHYKVGGFVGRLDVDNGSVLNISNNSVHGDITVGEVGGFIFGGYAYGELLIENCYTNCEITGYARAAGFFKDYSAADDKCVVRNCYSLSNIKTHNVFDADEIVGAGWGFGYQISHVQFINCFASGDIDSQSGGGFIWSITYSKLKRCFSKCSITILRTAGSSVFACMLSNTEVINCYSLSIVVYDFETNQCDNVLIKFMRKSKINNFYYSGNSVGVVVDIIENSIISNCHILRPLEQSDDLIGNDRGENPSTVDITTYKNAEEMYFLADKLNSGQEEVWVNQDNDFPVLKFES